MTKRIICSGEILYDFISVAKGTGLAGASQFLKKPGGSPFNIAIGLVRLRMDVAFLVKIGDDGFGEGLKEFLSSEKVDMSCIVNGKGHNTTLAMAAVNKHGKPEFQFYRENSADISLTTDELPPISPRETSAFSFGSIALADNPVGETIIHVFEKMRAEGVLTVLDPNVRPLYIENKPIFKKRMDYLIPLVDVLKLSDDDLTHLTDSDNVEEGLAKLETNPAGLVIVTEGAKGARALWRGEVMRVPSPKVEVAETTGCGDSFIAGVLSKLAPLGRSGFSDMSPEFLKNAIEFSNACAAIVATRYGAANAMPHPLEVKEFMQEHKMGSYGD